METVDLSVEPRSGTGKGPARQLRRSGAVPGVFYGPKRSPLSVSINAKEYRTKIAGLEGSTHLIKLCSGAQDLANKVALIKEVQLDPVSGALLHADFYEVDVTAKLRVQVPLHFVGKAAGIVEGGILQPLQREVLVECLPFDIPQYIEVDVTPLKIHDTIHIAALRSPAGVELVYDSDVALVTVLPPTVEEVKVEAAEAEAAVPVEGAAAEAAKGEAKGGAA
ncbi:MAG: 50S ribosomal protein L25/general stress protein Ctc [Deltaproteobacteria bacterium]|nr:50S ribosomal protein L25/general stress protein Ctc [Deltaproteobacteria bacterium]